jgi:hypothetical protein
MDPMRNIWRVLAFDLLAPLAAIAGLAMIGVVLGWPKWWVAVFSVLCLLVAQGMIVNFVLARRDRVTLGTDDDGPGLRLAVVGFATAALVAAVVVAYQQWMVPDDRRGADMDQVVRLSSTVAEEYLTFSPQDPTASIDKAAALMVPEKAEAYKNAIAKTAAEWVAKNISTKADTVSAGIELISDNAASVAVILRGTQTTAGSAPQPATLAMRVTLQKKDSKWLVLDVTPISPPPGQPQGQTG